MTTIKDFCFIISAHPSTEEQTSVLERCAKSIKNYRREALVIASGHCFPTRDVSEHIDYYVMDKNNEMLMPEDILEISSNDSMFHWWRFNTGESQKTFLSRGEINLLKPSHHYAAFKNIYNGIKLAEQLGYKYVVSCDADVEFNYTDLITFAHDCREVVKVNHDGIFFLAEKFGAHDSAVFFTKISTFLNLSGNISSKEDYMRVVKGDGHLLERFLLRLSISSTNDRGIDVPNEYRCIKPNVSGGEASREYFAQSKMNDPSQETLETLPIFSLCTYNPVEGFYEDTQWVTRNYLYHKENTEDRQKFLFFMQRGKTCTSCSLDFISTEGERNIILENLGDVKTVLEPLEDSLVNELLRMTNIKLECKFTFDDGETVVKSFKFANTEMLTKYMELNQILFE